MTATGTARRKHLTTSLRAHTCTEAVFVHSLPSGWLKCPFHRLFLFFINDRSVKSGHKCTYFLKKMTYSLKIVSNHCQNPCLMAEKSLPIHRNEEFLIGFGVEHVFAKELHSLVRLHIRQVIAEDKHPLEDCIVKKQFFAASTGFGEVD
jgi:hypothetical protein